MPKPATPSDFFGSMADPREFRALFEHLPGVFFVVKDAVRRMIAASAPIPRRLAGRGRPRDRWENRRRLLPAGDRCRLSR